MSEIRIVLTLENFKTLVSGGVVEKDKAKIILQDIGWFAMQESIDDARYAEPDDENSED